MMGDDQRHVVEPSLFERVSEYSAEVESGQVDADEPLSNTTPIVVFCQNFFAQFLIAEAGYTLTRIGDTAKEAVVRIRLQQRLTEGPVASLVVMFEDTCDIWPDILGRGYGISRADFVNFHATYLPQLLDEIVAWTSSMQDGELDRAARGARDTYAKALETLRPKL